jgi:hypothetical protein
MIQYANRGGDSGVTGYDITDDSISVRFRDGSEYLYDYGSAGRDNIEQMKTLAKEGQGLNEFISTTVRKRYARKLR